MFELAQADLNNDEVSFRKFKLIAEDVQGRNVITNFHGMSMTTDKLRSLIKKWQTCIEAHVDVKTTDGYLLRFFAIGFTRRRPNMIKKTCYAKTTQVRAIRKKMVDIITREVTTKDLKDVVNKLLPDSMGSDIEKSCQSIYPLHDCFIRKVKCLKKPKFDGMLFLEDFVTMILIFLHFSNYFETNNSSIFQCISLWKCMRVLVLLLQHLMLLVVSLLIVQTTLSHQF